jgi:hypothetical protein
MRLPAVCALVGVLGGEALADPGQRWDGGTIGNFFEGEGIGLSAGAAAGLFLFGVGAYATRPHEGTDVLLGALISIGVGAAVGLPIGAQIDADRGGGSGTWWGTAGATAISYGAAVGLTWWAAGNRGDRTIAQVVAALDFLLVLGGPFIGYELTSRTTPAATAFVIPLRFGTF